MTVAHVLLSCSLWEQERTRLLEIVRTEKDTEHEEGSHSGDSHDSIHRDHGSVPGGGPAKPGIGKRLMGWKGSFG